MRLRAGLLLLAGVLPAQPPASREERGAPVITVSHSGNRWEIAGKKHRVSLDPAAMAIAIQAGAVAWRLAPSLEDDMRVRSKAKEAFLRLRDAAKIDVVPYDTGYKTGVKITLDGFRLDGEPLDLTLYLTICLEGRDEDLVFDIAAREGEAALRQLDWPKQLAADEAFDLTVLSNRWGTLLPRNWSKEYSPIRAMTKEGKINPSDVSVVESNLIECWSMSWWGFQKGPAAMMIIVETPDDASYKFDHPAGGPTVIGPRWRDMLGRFSYPRTARMCFFERGNYVTLAKRYRRHVMDSGQFVSLREKIAREPLVRELIGTPHIRLHIKRNYRPGAFRYDPVNKERNYNVVTFDQRAAELRKLKARGIDRLYVCLAGWPYMGYDRQHPDELPPAPEAGGWEGMKRFGETLRELNYLFVLHDQYRDYYTDSPSFQEQFAIHEEDDSRPPMVFPGTRFGQSKVGRIPYMDYWDGGLMSYLSPRFHLGHLIKNYKLMFDHGVRPQGAYLDVYGYIPPDRDFNPQHPATRADSMKFRAACFRWVRHNLGLVGTEAAADWVVPYVDFGSANPGRGTAIPVPLYQLVYHDAIVIPGGGLAGMLYGCAPPFSTKAGEISDADLNQVRRAAALHARVGLLEMTNHEFLDKEYRKERTTFADGTTVTVDFEANTVEIRPGLN